jgi:hypothetical protein
VNTHELSWELFFEKIHQWFLHHVKPLGVGCIGIKLALGSTS